MVIKQKDLINDEAGQTLLEILLAFSASILVLSAVIMGIVTSLSNAQYTKNQSLANSYAQEGMAVVRKIRDSGWNSFSQLSDFTNNIKYCINKNLELKEIALTGNCLGNDPQGNSLAIGAEGNFSREVMLNHNKTTNYCCSDTSAGCSGGTAGSKATIAVSWADSKCPAGTLCHKVELITCFSSVDVKPTP